MCPTVSSIPKVSLHHVKYQNLKSCPTGHELLRGSEIETTYLGSIPMTVKQPGGKLDGSMVSLMNLLGNKYNFDYTTERGRTPNELIANVSR